MNIKEAGYYWSDFLDWCTGNDVSFIASVEYKIYWDCWKKAMEVRDKDDN